MPFKDLPSGSTHSFNDGCGEPEHNTMKTPIEKQVDEKRYALVQACKSIVPPPHLLQLDDIERAQERGRTGNEVLIENERREKEYEVTIEKFVNYINDITLTTQKQERESNLLGLAEAQLLGFHLGIWNSEGLEGLVASMGLTLEEWKQMQKHYDMTYLTEEDRREILEALTITTK